jgi:hypothetical protein
MERWIRRIERIPFAQFNYLTGNRRRTDDVVVDVAMALETYFIKILG